MHPGGACASWLAPLLTVRTGCVRPAGGRGGRSGACARRPRAREAVRTLPSGAQGSCVHPGGACASWLAPLLTVRTGRVRPAGGRGGRSGACARRPRAREAVRTLPSGAQGSCAPWGSVRKLVGAPADGANRPRPPCRGARGGGQELAPAAHGRGRRFARSPQVHKAAVHPGGACASWLAPLLTVRTGRVRPAGGRGGRSGACARRPRAREAVRTLPSGAQGSCAPWGSVRKLVGAPADGANRPRPPCRGARGGGQEGACARRPRAREAVRTLPSGAQGSCAPWGSVRKLVGAPADGANQPRPPCRGARGAVRSLRPPPTGAGGGSHAPLRCTRQLCTLGERAQVGWRPC